MAEGDKPDPLKQADEHVGMFINGGRCSLQNHEPATRLDLLVMLRQIRLAEPNISTSPIVLEEEIRKERRRML